MREAERGGAPAPSRRPCSAIALTLSTLITFATLGRDALAETKEAPRDPASSAITHETPSGMARVTLADALRRAGTQSTNVAIAMHEIERADALRKEARASSLPTLTGNGVYTRLDADRVFGGRVVSAKDQLSANLTLTVPLIVPQRWTTWSHASANVKAAEATADDVRRQTAIAVARSYLTVISQRRVVDVNERALTTARAHYEFAHTRLTGGIGNRVDAVRAEQEVATDQAQVETAYAALAKARESLGILVGDQGPLDADDDVTLPDSPSIENAMQDATSTRRDVVAARSRLDVANQIKKDGYTDYLPFLIGTAQPFYQNPDSLVQPRTGWQAQLLLTVPLYDGGLRYGLADEREALSTEARVQYEGLLRQARSDVRLAFESVKRAEAARDAAANAARLAKSALELANVAYRAGATTNIEVIDAERRARDAETSAAVAEDNARQARVDLLAASGRFP